jgi:hypothetical protein
MHNCRSTMHASSSLAARPRRGTGSTQGDNPQDVQCLERNGDAGGGLYKIAHELGGGRRDEPSPRMFQN